VTTVTALQATVVTRGVDSKRCRFAETVGSIGMKSAMMGTGLAATDVIRGAS
jgi:hypothetical protein